MKRLIVRTLPALIAAGLLAACASTPSGPPSELTRLELELDRMQADPRIAANAQEELNDAQMALDVLFADWRDMDDEDFEQDLYIADRLVYIAEAEGMARFADQHTAQLGREREQLLLDARTRQADISRLEAENARLAAHNALIDAEAARLQLERERHAAELARMDADDARRDLLIIEGQLVDLKTQQTDRGLVVTVDDVLFETDRADLKAGAARTLDKLAAALRDHPHPTIAIEGHTDSTGSRAHNFELSQRRALAVRDYLVSHGVPDNRLTVQSMGPDYPVASNAESAGRQQNRRVEIVIESPADVVVTDED